MSHSHPSGLLAAYNSLTDKHLVGYFNNTRIRRHLLRSGLITRNGRILSEKEYRLNIMKRDHQKYIRECLAQAIFHKVLDMERYHQLEIKKKLETLARKERIQRFKGEPTRWSIEKNMPVLSPHPPVGPKTNRGYSVLVDEGHSSPITVTAPRPHTAPGIMQPPLRLQPLPRHRTAGTVPKITPGSRSKTSLLETEAPFPLRGKKAMMKLRNSMDNSQGMKQYQPLNINSYMMPVPPRPPSPNGKITRENRSETWRRRRFRPTTAPNGLQPASAGDSRRINKTPLHSNAVITMIYLGKTTHLSFDYPDFRDEIKVCQQHCGGENLCVYRGKLLEKETFQFISKRHHGFPFSLTFFLNGMQVNRLSSCCEYKHRRGSRLGGKGSYFGFVCVEKSSPCYKCIIAMGLDKKPTSPKFRKQKSLEKGEEPKCEGILRKDRAYMVPRRNELEGSKTSSAVFLSADEEKPGVEDVRTAVEEMECKGKEHVWEDDQENTSKYEYEEDFEVDEEKQDEKANKKGQSDDQMNEMLKSPSDDEKDNLDPEKESASSQKAPDVDDSMKDESDGCSDSELEEDKQDIKTASSSSCRSHPYSSSSEDESILEDGEMHADDSADESDRSSSSQELSENDEPGKSHLLIEDSLEIEGQKIIKADVGIKPLPREESLENVLEETENGTQMIADGLSEKSREHVSKEEKENYRNKLWKGSTAKGKDKKAGLDRVEKGVPNRILMVEESTTLTSNGESKPVASEMYTLEKEAAMEEDEVPHHRDADTLEEKGGVTLGSKTGINEVPLGEWKPTAEQPALVALSTGERETRQGKESGAEAEGARELDEEGLNQMGKEAARASGSLNEEEVPEQQALMQTLLETEKTASEEEQSSEKVVFVNKAAAQISECVQEVSALLALTPEKGEAERGVSVSEAGSEKPGMEDSEEEAFIDLGGMAPEDDSACEREDGSKEAVYGGEEPVKVRKTVVRTETPLSPSTCEKTETTRLRISEESLEELCEKAEKRKDVETEVESNRKDDRKERLPEVLDAARQRRKAERPTPLGETESETEEVTRANALQDEDILAEEQKFKGEEGEIMKEETPGPPDETECDVENAAPVEGPEWTGDTGPQGDDSPRERAMLEAAPEFEKSLENTVCGMKEGGGERIIEAGDTGHKGRAELLCRENGEKVAPSDQEEGPGPEGEGVLGAPESDPAGYAQEQTAEDQDSLAGLERREKEGSLQGQQGVGATAMTQEDIFEGESMMAEKLSEEVMDENPEEEVDQGGSLGTGAMKNGHKEGVESLQKRMIVAKGDLQEGVVIGMVDEKREVLADLKIAEGKTEANTASPFSDVADEKTWHKVDELLEKIASVEKVAGEEIALVPTVEEVTVIGASEAEVGALGESSDLEEKTPKLGPEQKGGEAEMGSHGGGQESGKAEDVRLGLSQQTESELSRESLLQDVEILPGKANCLEIQEKQEHTVQRESENTDVSLNSKEA
uniref:Glutamate rich 3 n=1 Tax=Pipistrellus kuhlii TaxID=59472 RepID=A0A7J8A6X4_PIPKU|nr:glutamate rich 3 [Pipistrellus kuhlii]